MRVDALEKNLDDRMDRMRIVFAERLVVLNERISALKTEMRSQNDILRAEVKCSSSPSP